MATLEVEIGADLIKAAKSLALRHYGNDEDTSVSRVIEAALMMRLLWLQLVDVAGREVGEPVANWEFGDDDASEQVDGDLRNLLFKRR